MFGRSVKLGLLALLLFAPPAFARTHNFFTNTPFGFGLKAGVERRPGSDFAADPQTVNSLSAFYSFEPFIDFGNFVLKPYVELHSHPLIKGAGTDAVKAKTFAESSHPSSLGYGIQLMLVPFVSERLTARMYLLLGAGNISTSLKNERTYADGTGYTEKVKGGGQEYMAGVGYEFFCTQNYSIGLEGGYRRFTIDKFGYTGDVDVTGTARSGGETVKNPATGLVKKFHEDSPYFALALNMNF